MKDPIWKILLVWVGAAALLILFALLFSGCSDKKIAKAKRTLDESPIDAARYCADKFPIRDSIVYRDSLHIDTLNGATYYDTIEVECPDTVIKVVTKVEPKTIVKTVTQIKEVYRENTALSEKWRLMFFDAEKRRIDALDKLNKSEAEKKIWKAAARKWKWLLFAVIGFIVAWKFRNPIMRLIKF